MHSVGCGTVSIEEESELSRPDLHLAWGAATDVGKVRRVNEDSFLAAPGLFVVADGMGGHHAGDVASRVTIDACRDAQSGSPLDILTVSALVSEANSRVRAQSAVANELAMGTTIVGIALVDNAGADALLVFNVGDSRCYEISPGGSISQITTDHSAVQELIELGELSEEEARSHPDRNIVTRAIGIEDAVFADFVLLPRSEASRFLLCSDGVSNEMTDTEILDLLDGEQAPGDAAKALIDRAVSGPARDNATAVVVDVTWSAAGASESLSDDDVTGPRPLAAKAEVLADVSNGPRQDSSDASESSAAVDLISDVPT